MSEGPCSWCGVDVSEGDGFRAAEPVGERKAIFCRLGLGRCAHCGEELDDGRVLLIRHRGEHRIADAFCGTDHLFEWAKAGGRWRS
jgi:hypothetical protein